MHRKAHYYSSKNLGKSFPKITLRSIPASVIIPSRTTPPEEPSLDMARATAEKKRVLNMGYKRLNCLQKNQVLYIEIIENSGITAINGSIMNDIYVYVCAVFSIL